jgi:hypothetical protein
VGRLDKQSLGKDRVHKRVAGTVARVLVADIEARVIVDIEAHVIVGTVALVVAGTAPGVVLDRKSAESELQARNAHGLAQGGVEVVHEGAGSCLATWSCCVWGLEHAAAPH